MLQHTRFCCIQIWTKSECHNTFCCYSNVITIGSVILTTCYCHSNIAILRLRMINREVFKQICKIHKCINLYINFDKKGLQIRTKNFHGPINNRICLWPKHRSSFACQQRSMLRAAVIINYDVIITSETQRRVKVDSAIIRSNYRLIEVFIWLISVLNLDHFVLILKDGW